MKPTTVLIDRHPGRSAQSIGLARALGTDPDLIHEPSVGVVGTKGDSQCYSASWRRSMRSTPSSRAASARARAS